jgi:transposase
MIKDPDETRLPAFTREALGVHIAQLGAVKKAIRTLESKLQAWHRSQQASQRLTTIPGVGVMTSTALVATLGDGSQFKSG